MAPRNGVEMQAVVLCGGLATRLRPESEKTPKVLFKHKGWTILSWTLSYLKDYEVILAAGHLGEKVKKASPEDVKVVVEPNPLGTGGALRYLYVALDLSHPFVVMNGDIVTTIPLSSLRYLHSMNHTLVTMALTFQSCAKDLGTVLRDSSGKITEFGCDLSHMVNAGVYMISPEVFQFIPEGKSSLEKDLFPLLCKQKELAGAVFTCPWWHL